MQKAITWANIYPHLCHYMMLLGHYELIVLLAHQLKVKLVK